MTYNPNFAGATSNATSTTVGDVLENQSGATINRVTPVRVDNNGEIKTIDVSVESEATAIVGVAKENIAPGSKGTIISSGRVTNIITTANFGDILFVSKIGGLTNSKPEVGVGGFVSGDWVIRVGVIFKSDTNPSQQDLMLNIGIIGQL